MGPVDMSQDRCGRRLVEVGGGRTSRGLRREVVLCICGFGRRTIVFLKPGKWGQRRAGEVGETHPAGLGDFRTWGFM